MWFQAANPDQTAISIGGNKHPRSVFKYLRSQLLSTTDRQQHVKQASFGIIHSFLRYLLKHRQHTYNSFFFFFSVVFYFILFKFRVGALWQACREIILFFIFFVMSICPGVFLKVRGEAAIIPALTALAEGEFPMAPCRAAMSTVCLHSEWLRALCCRAQRISSSSLPKNHHGIWMSTTEYSLGLTIAHYALL